MVPARTTTSGIDPTRYAPLRHLGGFRSHPLLARHAPGYPTYDSAHMDVGPPYATCCQPSPVVTITAMSEGENHGPQPSSVRFRSRADVSVQRNREPVRAATLASTHGHVQQEVHGFFPSRMSPCTFIVIIALHIELLLPVQSLPRGRHAVQQKRLSCPKRIECHTFISSQ